MLILVDKDIKTTLVIAFCILKYLIRAIEKCPKSNFHEIKVTMSGIKTTIDLNGINDRLDIIE